MEKYAEGSAPKGQIRRLFLAVPIFSEGQSVGVIRVSDRKHGTFSELDEQALNLVASQIAACWRNQLPPRLFRFLTDSLASLDAGAAEFTQTVLREAAKAAAEVLQTDVLTLYQYSARQNAFQTPPVWMGDIRQRQFMNSPIHPDDAPWRVLRQGSVWIEHVRQNLARWN